MATIRIFVEDDVPAAAALLGRVYPEYRWISQAACESYIREIFFNSPWRDSELPSWVAEENGRICGFYGALSRPMVLRGRPIRVAVCCPFLVDTDHHKSLTALQLVKARLSGAYGSGSVEPYRCSTAFTGPGCSGPLATHCRFWKNVRRLLFP